MSGALDTAPPKPTLYSESPLPNLGAYDVEPLPTGSTSDLPPGLTPGGDRKLQSQLRSAYVEKQANDESAIDNRLLKQDRDRIQQQYDATAVQPGEFPKWNAEEQATKYRTDPLSAFGSLGSVAGMIASAFTHHPMQNAMEASAAAMNAIHAGDQKAYDQAHEAWKQNLDLAIKRHEIEQQRFGDAMKLMDTDIRLGEAQLRNNAIRFGNKQELAMLDAGMLPQLVETRAKMADTYLKLQAVRDDMEQRGISGAVAERMMKEIDEKYPKGSQERVSAMYQVSLIRNKLNSKDLSAQEYGDWASKFFFKEHRFPTDDEINEHTAELARAKRGGTTGDQQRSDAIDAERERLIRDEGVDPNVAQGMAVAKFPPGRPPGGTAGGGTVGAQQKAKKWEDVHADVVKDHPEMTPGQQATETDRRIKEAGTVLTAKQRDDILKQIGLEDRGIEVIDKTEKLLKTHAGISGLGGKIARPTETFSNILGSNSTAYHQFASYISQLQDWEKGLLGNAAVTGRNLSAAEKRASDIIPGLNLGDTSQRVIAQLNEVKKLMQQIRTEDAARLEGKLTPEMSQQITGTGNKPSGGSWRSFAVPAGP